MTFRKVWVGFAAAMLLVSAGNLTVDAQVVATSDATLTEQVLSRFAETWEPITDAITVHDGEFDRTHLTSLVNSLNDLSVLDGAHSALDEIVAKHGYSDFEAWASLARRAIVSAQWSLQPPDEAELKRTIVTLQSDPDIPEDQKQSLINDVSAAFQTALANKPSEADIAAAKAVLPLLKPIIRPDE